MKINLITNSQNIYATKPLSQPRKAYSLSNMPMQDSFISFCGINVEKNAKILTSHILSLPNFQVDKQLDGNYNHIGATLTDTVLQAGLKYDTVVKPKVLKVLDCAQASTVKGLLEIFENGTNEFKKIILWKDDKKPNLIISLAKFLDAQGINTEPDLKRWLETNENPEKLGKIKGIGAKTIDYIQILVGIKKCAIDRHLFKFIEEAGITINYTDYGVRYKEVQKIINKTAENLNLDASVLDHSIWSYMANKKGVNSQIV